MVYVLWGIVVVLVVYGLLGIAGLFGIPLEFAGFCLMIAVLLGTVALARGRPSLT